MDLRRGFVVVLAMFALTLSYVPQADAINKTTDQSDLWWVPTESGWGIQFVQNNNTIFATLFVYGPDNQPTWYSATLTYQGSFVWSGVLYRTTGPWFGAPAFDATSVVRTPVGTMSYNGPTLTTNTLTYTINGVTVVKTVERQLLVYESFDGGYAGVLGQQGSGPPCTAAESFDAASASVRIIQNSTSATVITTANGDTCTYPGVYSQVGHLGRIRGNYACSSGASGTFDFFEMVRTHADFRARMSLVRDNGCAIKGRMIGLEQPLPPQ